MSTESADSDSGDGVECPDCGRVFDTRHGLNCHRSRYCDAANGPEWHDEGTLRRLYIEEGNPLETVADRLGCGTQTVANQLEDFGIERRSRGEHTDARLHDEIVLQKLYAEYGFSQSDIADLLDCGTISVGRSLRRFGIETRSPTAHIERHPVAGNGDWLHELYHDRGKRPTGSPTYSV